MTLCPIAVAVGCKKCPLFAVCPLKTVIGDYHPDEHPTEQQRSRKKSGTGRKSR